MNPTTRFVGLLLAGLFIMFSLTVFAATNDVKASELPGASSVAPLLELQKLIVAIVVPLVVLGIRKALPLIPSQLLPPLAMALGALADYIGSVVGAWHGNIISGIVLGAAGIGVREGVNQLTKPQEPKAEASSQDP